MAHMPRVATFHLFAWQGLTQSLQALAFDRFRFRKSKGLEFIRVLGTGEGRSTAPGSELTRTALFCLFETEQDADHFVAQVGDRRGTRESWHVKMRGAGGHGAWRGKDIPRLLGSPASQSSGSAEPLAVITRAQVRVSAWRVFANEARVVDAELQGSDGLLGVVGIGEMPIRRLGTFSLWRSPGAMQDFARRRPEHSRVVARTRAERWYGEEMFARFTPYWSTGSWDGHDPLRS